MTNGKDNVFLYFAGLDAMCSPVSRRNWETESRLGMRRQGNLHGTHMGLGKNRNCVETGLTC